MVSELSDVDYCEDVPLDTGKVVGLSFATQSGFMSAVAVLGLLGTVVFKYAKRIRNPMNRSFELVRTNTDGLILNLLVADLFMSLGAILNILWANSGKVYCGGYCDVQGAIQLVGETSVAFFTLSITILTFISIFRGHPVQCRVAVWGGISGVVWLFVLLWAVIGFETHLGDKKNSFYAPTPYWCWISPKYKVQRLIGEYIWLWVAGFGSILLYTPLFFMLRGDITWDTELGWRSLGWRRRGPKLEPEPEQGDTRSTSSSQDGISLFALLWYPVAYTISILPFSIVRWITFRHEGTPSSDINTATFVSVFIFNLSGLVNVILVVFTRAGVLLLDSEPVENQEDEYRDQDQGQDKDHDSDCTTPNEDRIQVQETTGFGGPRVTIRNSDPDFDARVNRARSHE